MNGDHFCSLGTSTGTARGTTQSGQRAVPDRAVESLRPLLMACVKSIKCPGGTYAVAACLALGIRVSHSAHRFGET